MRAIGTPTRASAYKWPSKRRKPSLNPAAKKTGKDGTTSLEENGRTECSASSHSTSCVDAAEACCRKAMVVV